MRILLFALLLLPGLLAAQVRALVFIDSSQSAQSQLVNAMNQMLFYSPALRERLTVEVFDINPHARPFSGVLTYIPDRLGHGTARYRPEVLPFLICANGEEEILRIRIEEKEQLCRCIQGC